MDKYRFDKDKTRGKAEECKFKVRIGGQALVGGEGEADMHPWPVWLSVNEEGFVKNVNVVPNYFMFHNKP